MRTDHSIISHHLTVPTLDGLRSFYGGLLGMHIKECPEDTLTFGFPGSGCQLVFKTAEVQPYEARPNGFYWKIGITVRNLDHAVTGLRQMGTMVPDPIQFRDIGYMTHITDPAGFTIELLQQGFQGSERPVGEGHSLAAQATLAHITLRAADISAAHACFIERLGMRLMSVQPVESLNFCLYFYAWSEEALPHDDLAAVENREWLWRRSYTLIELQHLTANSIDIEMPDEGNSGFLGFSHGSASMSEQHFIAASELACLLR